MSSDGSLVKSAKSKSSSKSDGSASEPQHSHPDYETMLLEVMKEKGAGDSHKGMTIVQIVQAIETKYSKNVPELPLHVTAGVKDAVKAAVEKKLVSAKGAIHYLTFKAPKEKYSYGGEAGATTSFQSDV
ncbi:hypothetical protein M3Y99_01831600 [Aphelenchoides fujianensis]|nr:hypothetical protein M3Y99_01831600 [Aphelenchoides fujianensis]